MSEPERRTILLALSGSGAAQRALPAIAALAQRELADVHLLHDFDPTRTPGWLAEKVAEDPGRSLDEARQHLEEHLDRTAMRLREQGVPAEAVLTRKASAARAIVEQAEDVDASLLVIVTDDEETLGDRILGTVTSDILEESRRPILTLTGEQGRSGAEWRRVLVPTDFSENSKKALREALRWVPESATIELLYVVEEGFPLFHGARGKNRDHFEEEELDEGFSQDVEAFWREAGRSGQRFHAHRRQGKPEELIFEMAEELDVDLVVLPVEHDSWTRSLGAKVAQTPRVCPVLVVPA
jgi:nucleotide-binding universal stress UspA family protein